MSAASMPPPIRSGLPALDDILQGLRLGDNVVWQVDSLSDYKFFAVPFMRQALADGRPCVYVRFAPHPPILPPMDGLQIFVLDPGPGFDFFSSEVHRLITTVGRKAFYVFDNLSALVVAWATDELLGNFFQVTCPYLYELETVTYFALVRGQHAHSVVARIRDTTQILADVFHVDERMYLHPLKVLGRYSPQMFLPHLAHSDGWQPVFHSGDAARVGVSGRRARLAASASGVAPWETVYQKLAQYQNQDPEVYRLTPEAEALKQELLHMLLGAHPHFNLLADRYFTVDDLLSVRERVIGSGRIGGKAAGMLLARRILAGGGGDVAFGPVLEPHDSFYIGSDVFFSFLVQNNLFRLRLQLSRSGEVSPEHFAEVEDRFVAGKFSDDIMQQFREMLDYFGQAPIIVRSSSLLEDSFGNAFAGKYRSEFCANRGTPDDRLQAFLRAVKLVYASALNPNALSYRQKRGLAESDEQMAILVQRVAGMPYKQFFFPPLAGVAFSRNFYAWSNRIDPAKGVIRLVFGLGTRAVDPVGNDYPRMIPLSQPQARPEIGNAVARYTQNEMDLLDLEANALVTRPVREIVADGDCPNLAYCVSCNRDGEITDPVGTRIGKPPAEFILTFNNLIRRTDFARIMDTMLTRLEQAYGHPVDTEFTASVDAGGGVRINVLQCRPLYVPGYASEIRVPAALPGNQVLFRAGRVVTGGVIEDIRFILWIDPLTYRSISVQARKKALGRIVGRITALPEVANGKILLMGPGRWGSSNIDLGVNVSYADIANCCVLVEVARGEGGHAPELSFGTHFFQDLVEDQIVYLPVFPADPQAEFNTAFFASAENALPTVLPDAGGYSDVIRLIDLEAAAGTRAIVIADPQRQEAVCLLRSPAKGA